MRITMGLFVAGLMLTCAMSSSAQQALRVTWKYTQVSGTAAEWSNFVSSTKAEPTGIFDYCSWQIEDPAELPLSFPGERSPWTSTIKSIDLEEEGTDTLLISYDVELNDIALLSLPPEEASTWLCGVVEDWTYVVERCIADRFTTEKGFSLEISQIECFTHIGALNEIRDHLPLASQVEDLWFWSPWFRYFAADHYPWLFHETLGWIYITGDPEEFYFYHKEDSSWYYTKRGLFPEALNLKLDRWVIFR